MTKYWLIFSNAAESAVCVYDKEGALLEPQIKITGWETRYKNLASAILAKLWLLGYFYSLSESSHWFLREKHPYNA